MLLTQLVLGWATFWGFGPTVPLDNAAVTDVASGFRSWGPTVTLDNVTVTGVSLGLVNKWLGIPFAQPPTGNLRLQHPQPISAYNTSFSATAYGPSCYEYSAPPSVHVPDMPAETLEYLTATTHLENRVAEDCLSLNVIAPQSATRKSKHPVIVWIYGGGFESGDTATYDGTLLVSKSVAVGVPVVFVSMNYRMSAFGFLGSKEVEEAKVGNLGLYDQREAMRWIHKYIDAFGGDPTQVTLWGQSAGGVSIGLHMLTNGGNTEGLFHAAWMESGFPVSLGNITRGQAHYDFMVNATGCGHYPDTLECLRTVPYETFISAIQTPTFLGYGGMPPNWLPRVDGVFLTDNPYSLITKGSIAEIPFVAADCDDEGTLFSLLTSFDVVNVTQLQDYIHKYWYPDAPLATVQTALDHYPPDITQGSPFNTGYLNAITPQFKRLAAIQGDIIMQAPRRFLLEQLSGRQNTWSMLIKRFKWIPFLGSFHASSLFTNFFLGGDMSSRLLRFATYLDPNGGSDLELFDIPWPKWTSSSRDLLTYVDGPIPQWIEKDTYRADAISYLGEQNGKYPL
ncbi:Alpha/Beta hydrolase protein [Suillus ampliporus]|nr:Alpha/Beta hydrolase protein [Suillus ampliporus]